MEARTSTGTPHPSSRRAQLENQERAARLDIQAEALLAQVGEVLRGNTATQRRIDVLKLDLGELASRVDSLDMEDCQIKEKRAKLQHSIAVLEKKLAMMEDKKPTRLLAKFACGVVTGALGALLVIKLGGFLVKRVA